MYELEINNMDVGEIMLMHKKEKNRSPKSKANERIGLTKLNKKGKEITIVYYNSGADIGVKLEGEKELIHATYTNFINGDILSKSGICGKGFTGDEITVDIYGKKLRSYIIWMSMLSRSFSEKVKINHPTYKNVSCCEYWLCYSNFKKWYNNNYYEIDGEIVELDKDILIKGNKVYSPESCIFAPQSINTLFVKNDAKRGKYPIGVKYNKSKNKYSVNCKNKITKLDLFDTPELAFYAYKIYKENLIKSIANTYKALIPIKLYEAMCRYEVEITD